MIYISRQVLFISSDRDRRSFKENFSQMPFGAIPFGDRYAKNKLTKFLNVRGIPALMIFGPKPPGNGGGGNRPLLNPNIRPIFERGDFIKEFPYQPRPFGDINKITEDLNTHRFLIVFHEGGDDHEQDEIREALHVASNMYHKSSSSGAGTGTGAAAIKLCYAFTTSGLCESLRSVLRLGLPSEVPTMVLLSIPDSGAFYVCPPETEVTPESILDFMKSPGPRLQI